MTNVEKLEACKMIGEIRKRLGADSDKDTSRDSIINRLTNQELLHEYTALRLGDGAWWDILKTKFDHLENLSK